jgi:integrase
MSSQAAPALPPVAGIPVTGGIVILQNRDLLPGTDPARLSRFADPVWDLRPAGGDRHSTGLVIHWDGWPAALASDARLYVLALLLATDAPPLMPNARGGAPSVQTIRCDLTHLKAFCRWAAARGITGFAQVTSTDLDEYLWHVQGREGGSTGGRRLRLVAVQRLHRYRELLPEWCRLPAGPLWGGASAAELAGDPGPRPGENRIPRIHPDVMEPLLSAALLATETIAADILPAARRLLAMRKISHQAASPRRLAGKLGPEERWRAAFEQLDRFLRALKAAGRPLPAMAGPGGRLLVDKTGLAAAAWLGWNTPLKRDIADASIEAAGLRKEKDLLRVTRFTGAGRGPWRAGDLDARELTAVIRHVITACFLVIAYLSGVRTGEALNLRRGCISRDPALGLTFMSGLQLKASGTRRQRSPRTIPWVVTGQAAAAVAVLEDLTAGELLFPQGSFCSAEWITGSSGRTRTPTVLSEDIAKFTAWFNGQTAPATGHPPIPADEHGHIHPARLRRTLAWHIVRRPGGSIAAATQYGHLHTQITQGYAGVADSGFSDEIAFETVLLKAEQLHDDACRASAGEHLSGPAAAGYRERLQSDGSFTGLTLTSKSQARTLLANPALSIHHGELLTCVWREATAACRQQDQDQPDWGRCTLSCANITWTDRDIASARARIEDLTAGTPAMPAPLRQRTGERITRLRATIDAHEAGRPRAEAP